MRLAGFDLETTGFDGTKEHLVQSSFQIWDGETRILNETTLVNAGVSIGNSKIHGITTDMVLDAPSEIKVLRSIESLFHLCWNKRIPVVIMNAAFDITFYRDALRAHYGAESIAHYSLIDPFVIDRHYNKYRPGKRDLERLCEIYKISTRNDFHSAEYDVEVSVKVARAILDKYWLVANHGFFKLHALQRYWHKQQQKSLYEWFVSQGNTEAAGSVEYGWPIKEELALAKESLS